MTPEHRSELEKHLQAIHEILCRENLVKLKHGWPIKGTLADGRVVKHQLSISGYEIPQVPTRASRNREARKQRGIVYVERYEPNYGRKCEVCGQSPTVSALFKDGSQREMNLCGPCCFGEAACIDPQAWNE